MLIIGIYNITNNILCVGVTISRRNYLFIFKETPNITQTSQTIEQIIRFSHN